MADLKGRITLEGGWLRRAYFEGVEGSIDSIANPDVAKVGIPADLSKMHSFHMLAGVLGS